jgi:hypothetical protein
MCPSNIQCLENETNDSYSNAVIGILIIIISLSLGLSMLGVWVNASNGSQEDTFDLPFIPEKKSVTDINSQEISSETKISEVLPCEVRDGAFGGLCDEPVPECDCLGCFDTDPGTLEVNEELSKLPTGPLPLCIDNDYLDDYYLIVESVGGYSPDWGFVYLNQKKGDWMFEGVLTAHFDATEIAGSCPCAVMYNITFTTKNPICLDSNHLPYGFDQSKTLGKEVCVSYSSMWEGCPWDTQKFMVILAHKAMSQNPKLPIYYTSPVS